jgi:hypothetical protein
MGRPLAALVKNPSIIFVIKTNIVNDIRELCNVLEK